MLTVPQSAATRPLDEHPHSRAASPPPPRKILPDGTVIVEGTVLRQIAVDLFEVTWQWGSLRREVLARLDRKLRECGARGNPGQRVRLLGRLYQAAPWTIVFVIPSRQSRASCP